MIPKPRHALCPDSVCMGYIFLSTPLIQPSEEADHSRLTPKPPELQQIAGAPNTSAAAIQHMGIDHRRVDILMPQKFLDSANIVASFEQVRGKRMPEGVAARRLGDPCLPYGRFHGTLQHELTHVMPPFNTAARVDRTCCRREDILPSPFTIGIQILSLQGIWRVDA